MSTYIIGDVQGCYKELQQLLELINYNPDTDRLGFVGDLVNRGSESLATLRFIKSLNNPIVVLGNHDLHLLALGYQVVPRKKLSSLDQILAAKDKIELLEWLRHQHIIYQNQKENYLMVHAGIPPQWNIQQATIHAKELTNVLQSENFKEFLANMHGYKPDIWSDDLTNYDRLRYITNAFTRIRFCDQHGKLDLENKSATSTDPKRFKPWFEWLNTNVDIIFGHWASLQGKCKPGFYAIDTGCVWGGKLTALRIEDRKLFQTPTIDY